ncbi:MAG: 50S ribosomal protein L5 [Pseudomonadales bacterium]|nr:50S ribosomal protein L5 [Pseudomonadales bacterium]
MKSLEQHYLSQVRPALMEQFGYTSVMQAPRLVKISLNMGLGAAIDNKGAVDDKFVENAVAEMKQISGQQPIITRARKSEAAFHIRTGHKVGCRVTLRRSRMYDFVQRLVGIAIPRIRDFRGLNARSFDGRGNFSMGVKEQIIFTEIDYDKIDRIRGMDIAVTTTARTDEEGLALLRGFEFPFAG